MGKPSKIPTWEDIKEVELKLAKMKKEYKRADLHPGVNILDFFALESTVHHKMVQLRDFKYETEFANAMAIMTFMQHMQLRTKVLRYCNELVKNADASALKEMNVRYIFETSKNDEHLIRALTKSTTPRIKTMSIEKINWTYKHVNIRVVLHGFGFGEADTWETVRVDFDTFLRLFVWREI